MSLPLAGGTPTTLTSVASPARLHVDDTHVYFGDAPYIRRIAEPGGLTENASPDLNDGNPAWCADDSFIYYVGSEASSASPSELRCAAAPRNRWHPTVRS